MATIKKKTSSVNSTIKAAAAQRALAAAKKSAASSSGASSNAATKSKLQSAATTYKQPAARTSSSAPKQSSVGSGAAAAKAAINNTAARSAATNSAAQMKSNPAATQALLNKTAAATGGATPTATTPTTPGTPGAAGATGSAKTAFGKRFSPDTIGMVTANPAALIQSYYDFQNRDPYTGEMALSMEQNANSLRNLFTLFGPNSGDPTGVGQDAFSYADWAGGYLQNAQTQGAKYYSPQDVVNRLMTQDEGDTIFSHLYAGTAPDVSAYRFNQSYENALAPHMVPEVFSANMSWMNQMQNQFVAEKAAGGLKEMNFAEYLKSKGFEV